MHVLNYCLFLYFRQNFSNTTTCRCKLCKLDFFNIFYQYSIIWIQLTFNFFKFYDSMEHLGSTFYQKAFIYTMILKKLFNIFELIFLNWYETLIFPHIRFRIKLTVISNISTLFVAYFTSHRPAPLWL